MPWEAARHDAVVFRRCGKRHAGKASARFAVNGLSIDTRTLKAGDLFVALKGDNRDGHDFVAAAFAAKAGAALVHAHLTTWRARC